ncbi:MAG: hypothetical protein CMC81_05985 [Flavobacteriaceae bacterium]|nr:hypothetical protein [Flavobacteriaceae bacterium]
MKRLTKSLYLHTLIIFCFALFAQLFYYPTLSGKKLLQSDIVQYSGMSKQLKDYRSQNDNKETYWIDNAFGGMPTYQLGAKYPVDILGPIHNISRILPRPAHLLFLFLLSSYILFLVLKFDWKLALFGSFAFGLSTYLLIILQVGHNTKAMAIAYMPLALSGFFLLIDQKWVKGFILSVIGLGLNIRANHYQMSYYLLILLIVISVSYLVYSIKKKNTKLTLLSLIIFFMSGIIAIGLNSTPILATSEYSKFSTRNGSELSINFDGSPKEKSNGLDYEYITQYSYGIFESLSLIIPRINGGGSRENVGKDSGLYEYLIKKGASPNQSSEFVSSVPTYWGSQPILEAPAYIGIVVFLFVVFSVIVVKGPLVRSLLIASIISLLLSWGKNLPFLTNFFIEYFPFYNKFRAVSSIQVILELCFPILALIGLKELIKNPNKHFKTFLKLVGTLILFLFTLIILNYINAFSFTGPIDSRLISVYGQEIYDQIIITRSTIFNDDILRGVYLLTSVVTIFLLLKSRKISEPLSIICFSFILFIDLFGIANRYIDMDRFVSASSVEIPYKITEADKIVLQDNSRYRVYEPGLGLNGSRTSFFHNSMGGYHGAKPRRFQEFYDFLNYNQIPELLNILNVKYVLYESDKGLSPLINEEAMGNAWFVDSIIKADSADKALALLKTINFKNQIIVEEVAAFDALNGNIKDQNASIDLIRNSPNKLEYLFESESNQTVVFSEIYYPKGWKAKIDGKSVKHYRVNYILRALSVEKGKHIITFEFEPTVVETGTKIRYATILIFLIFLATIIYITKFNSTFKKWVL